MLRDANKRTLDRGRLANHPCQQSPGIGVIAYPGILGLQRGRKNNGMVWGSRRFFVHVIFMMGHPGTAPVHNTCGVGCMPAGESSSPPKRLYCATSPCAPRTIPSATSGWWAAGAGRIRAMPRGKSPRDQVSLAHHGVLFLDELPELSGQVKFWVV